MYHQVGRHGDACRTASQPARTLRQLREALRKGGWRKGEAERRRLAALQAALCDGFKCGTWRNQIGVVAQFD